MRFITHIEVHIIKKSMSNYDLIDFILENNRWRKIYPINKIKSAILSKGYSYSSPNNIESVRLKFKNVGTCIVTDLLSPSQFQQLVEYYVPWYRPDNRQIGFGQYLNQFIKRNASITSCREVRNLIESLREGWKTEIEIIIAFDTIRLAGVVVDGTKHSLALFVIKEENKELLARLMKNSAPVKLCKMSSSQCATIFHEDFKMIPHKLS